MGKNSSPPPRLTLDELGEIILAHRQWLRSAGQEGQKPNLSGANLAGLDLDGYDLSGLDFREAILAQVRFGDALVEGANFRGADLREADLSGARHLLGPQLAGADLSGATLPEDVEKFESLPHVNAAIKHAQTTFFALLLVCVFCWLAIAITTDAGLITNTIETQLPIVNTKMNIAAFYLAAPLLLFCLYIYLQLRKQRLWEALSELPSVFPDGQPLPYHLHPWLGSGLLWTFLPRLRHQTQRPNLIWVENHLFKLLSGWLAPITLLALWWRSLPAHSWLLNGPQIALLSPALAAGLILPMYARYALRLRASRSEMLQYAWGVSVITVIGAVAAIFSYYAFTGWFAEHYQAAKRISQANPIIRHRPLNPIILGILETMSNSTCANLKEVEVSTKPPQWTGKPADIDLVRGAFLRGRNLRGAEAFKAFLVKADLSGANLQQANLSYANLRQADLSWFANLQQAKLSGANLQQANMFEANLQQADLSDANLQQANLQGADFREAQGLEKDQVMAASCWPLATYSKEMLEVLKLPPDHNERHENNLSKYQLPRANLRGALLVDFNLHGANLKGADLGWANLWRADLTGADLRGANLKGADLREAKGLTRKKLKSAIMDEKTKLPDDLKDLVPARSPRPRNYELN